LGQGGSGKLYSDMNLFDTEELTAYITTVHHALTDAVKTMMEEQKIDYTKIERRTQGFLNVI
jgi:coproporphyrinogen III oxidase